MSGTGYGLHVSVTLDSTVYEFSLFRAISELSIIERCLQTCIIEVSVNKRFHCRSKSYIITEVLCKRFDTCNYLLFH